MQKDIFIQARTGSTRMPGKILQKVGGIPIIVRTFNRIRKSSATNVVIITSKLKRDDEIEEICSQHSIPLFRGSENDLLDRHFKASSYYKSDFVFKIPSDCPFSDFQIINKILDMSHKYDYVSNYHPPTFPDGLDVEGSRFDVLENAWKNAKMPHEREHTFPFVWDNPLKFKIGNLENFKGNMFMTHRWTLDYPEDLQFIEQIYKYFDYSEEFNFYDILNLLKIKPMLSKINSKYNGVNWYRNEKKNLKTVDSSLYNEIKK